MRVGSVCPSTLRDDLFTTGTLDNIDNNASSTLSRDSFHGTALSITQYITNCNPGEIQSRAQPKFKSIMSLQQSNTNESPISFFDNIIPTITDGKVMFWLECRWNDLVNMSWSAYFASFHMSVVKPPAIIVLLPLFWDDAPWLAMVNCTIQVNRLRFLSIPVWYKCLLLIIYYML